MLDHLIRFSLRNRLFVVSAAIGLLLYGFYTALKLPVDVFPDLNAPTVTVLTEAHGLAPEEVESLVTFPLETAVNGATGVRRVRSFSAPGISIVHVEFDWSWDVYTARQIVTEKLQAVAASLPEGVERPIMAPVSSIMGEIMLVTVTAEEDSEVTAMELRTLADWTLRRRLLAISGIAQVVPIGGDLKQFQVRADPQKLAAYDISLQELFEGVSETNKNATGGAIRSKGREYLIRGIGRAFDAKQLANAVIATRGGLPVKISDVAEVGVYPAFRFGEASANGQRAVVLSITKQPHANTLELTERIEAAVADITSTLPAGVVVETAAFKQADFINIAIENVIKALRDGSILVVVVLFLFLGNFRVTFISVMAIPLSMAATFLVFDWFDVGINTMTLGGIGIAIGALVDDAIIYVENAYRRLRENYRKREEDRRDTYEVVMRASQEIRRPMASATLIITIVFLPLFFLSGVEGRLLLPMGLAYIVSIFASLAVALLVTPALAYLLLPASAKTSAGKEGWLERLLKVPYRLSLNFALRIPNLVLLLALGAFAGTAAVVPHLGRSFLPEFNEGALTISLVKAPGTSLDVSDSIARTAENRLLEIDNVKYVSRRTGRAELDEHAMPVNMSEMEVVLDLVAADREETFAEVREALAGLPGTQVTVGQPISHRIDHMLSGTRASIAVKLFGPDLATLRRLAEQVETAMSQVQGVVDLAIEPMVNVPQIRIQYDRDALAAYGMSSEALGEWIDVAFNGEKAGQILEDQRSFDIVVRYPDEARADIETIRNTLIDTPNGARIPLSEMADVRYDLGPNQIGRENAQRKLVVQSNVAERDLGGVITDIQERIAATVELPGGYYIEYGGQFESEQAASQILTILSLMTLVGIFLILYQEFSDMRATIFILANLPLALIGGIWSVYFTGGVISIASLVGFITLFGIAVRNGVLLVAHYQTLLREGKSLQDAIRQGSEERLNPIMMTALTAALALIPLALGVGQPGKEIEAPMAIVILGGLITSTFLNMIVVPCLFWKFGMRRPESATT